MLHCVLPYMLCCQGLWRKTAWTQTKTGFSKQEFKGGEVRMHCDICVLKGCLKILCPMLYSKTKQETLYSLFALLGFDSF